MKVVLNIICSVMIVILGSCSESKVDKTDGVEVCGTQDPINNLKWLNKEFESIKGNSVGNAIVLYKYNDRDVIEVQNSLFSSTNIHQYYCNGDKLDLISTGKFEDFKKNRTEVKVLFGTKIWNL